MATSRGVNTNAPAVVTDIRTLWAHCHRRIEVSVYFNSAPMSRVLSDSGCLPLNSPLCMVGDQMSRTSGCRSAKYQRASLAPSVPDGSQSNIKFTRLMPS